MTPLPIEHQVTGTTSSVELVYQRTRQSILSGELEPDTPLRVQELADRNGVSMIPVREALRKLESEGFVESVPNRGARVAPISLSDMVDGYQTRVLLEMEALRLAIPKFTANDLERASELNTAFHTNANIKDVSAQWLHKELHFQLYRPSASRWLLKLIELVWDHSERYRMAMAAYLDIGKSYGQHQAIIDALGVGDHTTALTSLETHLTDSRDLLASVYAPIDDIATKFERRSGVTVVG